MPARTIATALALVLAVFLAFAAPTMAEVVHAPEGSFEGADAPGGPFGLVTGVALDNSGGPSDG
ncbi:MAG TPA: hypothetical protein VLK89_03605, partial [Solirubrobacterales bacterium]|nr:hypothetical protein [Solirubrobacterales bacterium]